MPSIGLKEFKKANKVSCVFFLPHNRVSFSLLLPDFIFEWPRNRSGVCVVVGLSSQSHQNPFVESRPKRR